MNERTWALGAHVAAYLGFVIPFGNVLGPLVIWMWKREVYPLVREHGRESLNFQISFSAYMLLTVLVAQLLVFAAVPPEGGSTYLVVQVMVLALFGLLLLGDIALVVTGALRAYQGLPWRYPLTFRLVK
jgi:uncharacterized protein